MNVDVRGLFDFQGLESAATTVAWIDVSDCNKYSTVITGTAW